ncbi:MucR family transcriptional regulator [Sphingomonas morindae]|uniref:MucR family transcriptional regulator n=1 Tax=Sphingomonas morindae TaxID=1541170 RepID=A0ABY4X6S6_9SPHN|nr:MucR family transcriptional regulator [Sphingomonas morindae]USI72610.1 MucR family transcriptional regulator [Sphingomonas morindae]
MSDPVDHGEGLVALTADIVAAHVAHNAVPLDQVAGLIRAVHEALAGLGAPAPAPATPLTPAVPIRASVKPDHIVCLEDGKKLKMLKRHLAAHYDLTPDQYRRKWNLPHDYPMVAPAYAARRSALAKEIGLGKRPRAR